MTDNKKYNRIKNQVKKLLKEKNLFEISDLSLIEELIYNIKLSDSAKTNIDTFGLMMNVSKDPEKPYFQQNPSISIYNSCIKNIGMISTKLSITPAERSKLKIEEKKDTTFSDAFK